MQATVCTGRSEPHRRSREATSRRTSLAALVGGRPAGRPRAPLPHRRRGRGRALRARRRRALPRAGAALMFETLADHLEIVWGALAGFAIVVVLTPAVGGVARRLGAVDRPERRRLNRQPVPRLGGLALFFGIFVPALAFLDLTHEARGCCSAPQLRRSSARSTTFAGSSGGRSSPGRWRPPLSPSALGSGCIGSRFRSSASTCCRSGSGCR